MEIRESAMPAGADDDEIRVLGSSEYRRRRGMIVNDLPGGGKSLSGRHLQCRSLKRTRNLLR